MGWRPDDVRGCLLLDFAAAFRGWQRAQGIDPDGSMRPMTRAELRELMAQYPD